jgi:hypothetical protein
VSEYSERICVVCGCGDVDLEPHPEFGGALLCRHCWPAHDSGRLDSPPERWREHDERDDRIGELESEVARLRGLLGEVEHAAAVVTDRGVEPSCPICCRAYPGHAPDCRLAAALEVGHG